MAWLDFMDIGDAVADHIVVAQARQQGKTAMLGDTMMRAGIAETAMAQRDKLPAMSINKYRTPTANNAEVPFSIGIMNMTEAECETIIGIARQVEAMRRGASFPAAPSGYKPASGPPPPDEDDIDALIKGVNAGVISKTVLMQAMRRREDRKGYDAAARAKLLTQIANDPADERRKFLTGDWALGKADEEKEIEPEVKGNRFSGLDIE